MIDRIRDAIRIFLQQDVELLPPERIPEKYLGLIPKAWKFMMNHQVKTSEIIQELWSPIQDYAPRVIQIMQDYCSEIRMVVPNEGNTPVMLCYLLRVPYRQKYRIHCWVGKPPRDALSMTETESKHLQFLPHSYNVFTHIHNGFSVEGNEFHGLFPGKNLIPLSSRKELEVDETQSLSLRLNRLIEFSGDILGNRQCYDLDQPIESNDFMTTFWDHETRQNYDYQNFWDYLNKFFIDETGISLL